MPVSEVAETERFEAIDAPPVDDVTRTRRWTANLAHKRVGQRPYRPGTVQEKVERVHDLAVDEDVAVEVTRDVLRWPAIVARLMEDTAVRQAVADAQKPEHRAEAVQRLVRDDGSAAKVASDVLRRPEVAARVAADDAARRMPGPREAAAGQRVAHHLGVHHADDPPPHPQTGPEDGAGRPHRPAGRGLTNIHLVVVTPTTAYSPGASGFSPRPNRRRQRKNSRFCHSTARSIWP